MSIPHSESKRAEKMAQSRLVREAFPGLVRPSKKKILELAISLGLKEIGREARL